MFVEKVMKKVYEKFLSFKWKGLKGFSSAIIAKRFIDDYKNKYVPLYKTMKIHKKGFTVADWCYLGLTKDNYEEYLSNVQYLKMHPINGEYSKWIDDKLTLKYILSGTDLDKYMPEYYFQIDSSGNILRLMDYNMECGNEALEDFVSMLKEKKVVALKRIAGAIGDGFYKAEYNGENFCLNGVQYAENEFCNRIKSLKNYLVTEYLKPHKEIARFCPDTANSIRYLVGRIDGEMKMLKSFIRFGTKKSKFIENYNAGGVLCYINEDGKFSCGNIIDNINLTNNIIYEHPDSKKELVGRIPLWDEIIKVRQLMDEIFPQMKYLGIDFVVTSEDKVKILEINSLTSLDALQMDTSILKTDRAQFFLDRLQTNR